jgi:hypothetical protein
MMVSQVRIEKPPVRAGAFHFPSILTIFGGSRILRISTDFSVLRFSWRFSGMRQCDAVWMFVGAMGRNRKAVISALAKGLANGSISWKRNSHGLTSEEYAEALYRNWVERPLR